MDREEVKLQAALYALQGIIEGKGGVVGETLPRVAAKEAIRIANAFCDEWFKKE